MPEQTKEESTISVLDLNQDRINEIVISSLNDLQKSVAEISKKLDDLSPKKSETKKSDFND